MYPNRSPSLDIPQPLPRLFSDVVVQILRYCNFYGIIILVGVTGTVPMHAPRLPVVPRFPCCTYLFDLPPPTILFGVVCGRQTLVHCPMHQNFIHFFFYFRKEDFRLYNSSGVVVCSAVSSPHPSITGSPHTAPSIGLFNTPFLRNFSCGWLSPHLL